uniref:Retrotransposon Copia-like N-terminal domain-containing protein n=1 Tax=Chenopodium quinoa TaxID=63459 RepID=A0A803MV59_CHEQI
MVVATLNDAPGNVITLVQFRGENYDEWARAVRTSLKAKRKFGFIDGSVVRPSDPAKLDDWSTVHSMLVSWLTNTLDPSVRATIGDYDDAQLLWFNLKNRYCVVNGTRICRLKNSLSSCRQEKKEAVASYFGRLSKFWDELHTYLTVQTCSCGLCTCNIVSQVERLREEDHVHHFLLGLDDKFASIHGQLLAQEPLPGVNKAY